MKKTFILALIVTYCCCIYSQTTPCTNEMLLAKKAQWKLGGKVPLINSENAPKILAPEFIKRIDALHKLVLEAYPEGAGTEPWWSRFLGYTPTDNKTPYSFRYGSGFPFYYCSQDFPGSPDEKSATMKCYCAEYGTLLDIYANTLPNDLISGSSDITELNGKPVYKMAGHVGKWKGYDVFNLYGDSAFSERVVVISRKGILPFRYITRKEILQSRIDMYKKFKADMGADPNTVQTMDVEIKKYQDEMKRTPDSLLNSPAIIGGVLDDGVTGGNASVVFSAKGDMLITENPNYFRKDLPRHIPQYFILHWQWFGFDPNTNRKHLVAPEYFAERINEYFPIEKLQAMIDK